MFATYNLKSNNNGAGITLDKLFGSNFKEINVPSQAPLGFKN
jgi:hypothetical protein